jgi:hypothetical protein
VSCVPETGSEIVKELEARFLSFSYGLVVQALSPKKGEMSFRRGKFAKEK